MARYTSSIQPFNNPAASMSAPLPPIAQPAGLFRRLAAIVYDTLLLFAVLFFSNLLILPWTDRGAVEPGNPLYTAFLLLIGLSFFGWFWSRGGQTLGMKTWRLKLESVDGKPISRKQIILRYFGAILSWTLAGLGFLWIPMDKKNMALHDHLSGTRIMWTPKKKKDAKKVKSD